jgi:PAS domain S-box-containing protein
MKRMLSSTNKETNLLTVLESDPEIRRQVLAAINNEALSSDLSKPITILGPSESLDHLPTLHSQGRKVLVLAFADQTSRMQSCLQEGAVDAMCWTSENASELVLRIDRIIQNESARRSLEIERRDLSALLELSEALTTSSDIEATLHQIAKRMAEVMHSERCSIVLIDENLEHGIVVADSQDAGINNHPIPLSRYPEILQVVRTRRALVVDNVHNEPLFDEVRDIIRDKEIGHTAIFPVNLNTRVQGIFMMRGGDVRTEGLTPRQIRFASIVANATAIAIRNARMYRSIRDRTERVLSARIKAERRLRQIEKYQRFFDLAGDGLAIVDGRGQILFANQAALEIFAFSKEDFAQLRLSDVIVEADIPLVRDLFAGFVKGQFRSRFDLGIIRSDGTVRTLSVSSASLDPEADKLARELHRDLPKGRVIEVAAIISFRDVTETRVIQSELRRTKDFLENVIASSADAIIASDMQGKIVIYNLGAERILGYAASDVIGKMKVTELYAPGVARSIMKAFWSESHGGKGRYDGGRHELIAAEGQRIPISISAALIFHDDEPIASVGIFKDLRERIRMESELEYAQKKLEKTERQAAVVELAGTAAHELSQPLTTIMGTAELMQRRLDADAPDPKIIRTMVDRILNESERMADLLRKIGQITKYETKPYLKETNILDLDASTEDKESK